MYVHLSVADYSKKFLQKWRRVNHVTPKNYLDFINSYTDLLKQKDKFFLEQVCVYRICLCACMHVCMRVCACMCACVCVRVCGSLSVWVYLCLCVYVYILVSVIACYRLPYLATPV